LGCLKLHPQSLPAADFVESVNIYGAPQRRPAFNPRAAMQVLSAVVGRHLCPELKELYLRGDFMSQAQVLAQWVQARADGHLKLRKVALDTPKSPNDYLMFNTSHSGYSEKVRSIIKGALEPTNADFGGINGLVWVKYKTVHNKNVVEEKADPVVDDPDEREYQAWLVGERFFEEMSP
ncbi:hypothetical protein FRC17_002306, partial [Serendipita sp. 399]